MARLKYILARYDYSLHPCFLGTVKIIKQSKCGYVHRTLLRFLVTSGWRSWSSGPYSGKVQPKMSKSQAPNDKLSCPLFSIDEASSWFISLTECLAVRSSADRKDLLHHFQENVSLLREDQKSQLLDDLTRDVQPGRLDEATLKTLQRVMLSCKESTSETLHRSLAGTFMVMHDTMIKSTDSRASMLSMQCLSVLMIQYVSIIFRGPSTGGLTSRSHGSSYNSTSIVSSPLSRRKLLFSQTSVRRITLAFSSLVYADFLFRH